MELNHFLVPFLFLVGLVFLKLILIPKGQKNRLHFAVVDVEKHNEAFFGNMFNLLSHLLSVGVVSALSVLVHDVLAEAVVPSL